MSLATVTQVQVFYHVYHLKYQPAPAVAGGSALPQEPSAALGCSILPSGLCVRLQLVLPPRSGAHPCLCWAASAGFPFTEHHSGAALSSNSQDHWDIKE